MKKQFPKTLATLVLASVCATTGLTAAQASSDTFNKVGIEASVSKEQAKIQLPAETVTSMNSMSPLPLFNESSFLSTVLDGELVQASVDAKLSFERSAVRSTPAPPDPAVVAAEKAKAEAKVKAEAQAKAEAEAAAVAKAEEEATAVAKAEEVASAAQSVPAAGGGTSPARSSAPAAQAPAQAAPKAPVSNLPQNLSAYQQYAAQEMSRRGLNGASELTCLIPLWNHESNWNPNAANPTSTARGIPQMMMNIHYGANWQTSAAGVAYLTNPEVQIDKGLDYIIGRYGSPCNAWGVWQTQRWY